MVSQPYHFDKKKAGAIALCFFVIFSTMVIFFSSDSSDKNELTEILDSDNKIILEVWHTFATESKEEESFNKAIKEFQETHPNITVEATMIPYSNADQLFMTAAQGGEAPDLMRLSNDKLGEIGEVRVDGQPILEDLRPHLTPAERLQFDTRALEAMRYGDALYGIPASQDSLSLIYNKALFDIRGLDYPNEMWTESDLLNASKVLTFQDVYGLSLPVKSEYWWFPFQEGFGGSLFDQDGNPTLNSSGSSESMNWMLDLELNHSVVKTGTQKEKMKTEFLSSKAAMIIDGPWNWATYESSRLNIGQTLLPIIESTGERMSPLITYKGWTVSKQSLQKEAAVELSLWLSSESVQKDFALETYTMPTHKNLEFDDEIANNTVISGFLKQIMEGTPAPTTRGMALVYEPLSIAFERNYTELSTAEQALNDANNQLIDLINNLPSAEPPIVNEGYRTIELDVLTNGASNYTIFVDGKYHSKISKDVGNGTPNLGYDSCTSNGTELLRTEDIPLLPSNTTSFTCNLTGMTPGFNHNIEVFADGQLLMSIQKVTDVIDVTPTGSDTSPIMFALGAITLSLIALLSFSRWRDYKLGRVKSRLAQLYVAPALLALALLTFYPVIYGFWLAFTDADQTHLGEQSFVGLQNFVEVIVSSGFVRVTIFTLVWTVVNVTAHISLGLFLALLLQRSNIRGKTAYRTILLLPWAIPSYISVLVWKGIFQPDGLINDILGTDIDFLSDPTGAQIIVILVNIWLGVPFMMMSLSGAIQALPQDMYEAAKVDGVSDWKMFRYLTLPNLKSALVPLSLLGFIWTFNMFNVIYLMTDGGPNLYFGQPGQTDILITYVYDVAFRDGAYGVAAAWSVIIFLILVTFSWTYMKQTNATEASS